jgi:FkbM family methyltransferase
MAQGVFEADETAIVHALLPHVAVFLNVGANRGYYCCLALQHGVPTIAIEPMAANLEYLYRNIVINGWNDAIEVLPVAVSNRSGLVPIFGANTGASIVPGWGGAPLHQVTIVPTSTLDLLIGSRLAGRQALVVMDVEGAEYAALSGARRIICSAPRPIWLVEITTRQNQPVGVQLNANFEKTFTIFFEAGYEAWTAERQPRQLTPADIQAIARGSASEGVHNFLFTEADHGFQWITSASPDNDQTGMRG